MICPKCGHDVPGPVFCRSCGARMLDAPPAPGPHAAGPGGAPPPVAPLPPVPPVSTPSFVAPPQPHPEVAETVSRGTSLLPADPTVIGPAAGWGAQALAGPPVPPLDSPPTKPGNSRAKTPLIVLISAVTAAALTGGGLVAWKKLSSDDAVSGSDARSSGSTAAPGAGADAAGAPAPTPPPPSAVVPAPTMTATPKRPKPELKPVSIGDPVGDVYYGNDRARPAADNVGDITGAKVVPTGPGVGRIEITFSSGRPDRAVNVYLNVNASASPEYLVHADFEAGRFSAVTVDDWVTGTLVASTVQTRPSAAGHFPNIPAATSTTVVIPYQFSRADLPRKTIALCIQSIQSSFTDADQYDYLGGAGDGNTPGRTSWTKPVRVLQ